MTVPTDEQVRYIMRNESLHMNFVINQIKHENPHL